MAGDYTVRRNRPDGSTIEEHTGLSARSATLKYGKNLARFAFKGQHHMLIKGTPLPGLPEQVIAEHFTQAGE